MVAGDTAKWNRAISDYPTSEGWLLSYAFRGPQDFDVSPGTEVTVANNRFEVVVLATKTAKLAPGTYHWAEYVTKAAERYRIQTGTIYIEPDLASREGHLTTDEKELRLVDAAIAELLETGTASYQVNGRAVNKQDLALLEKIRGRLRRRIRASRQGGRVIQSIGVKFVQPG